jgi:hypothetical protein
LAALARADEGQSPKPEVEKALLQAFRRKQHSLWIRRCAGWGALAAAAALVWIAVQPGPKQAPIAAKTAAPAVVFEMPAASAGNAVATARPLRPKPVRGSAKREVVTNFIPVMVDPDPFERGRLVRVKLPRSALSAFGLPVNEEHFEERIQADVLVGEDGLARAIRFVK